MSFPNTYTHRRVADTASRPCDICYKPSTSVLVVPNNQDYFYVCPGHLKDKAFCTPIIDEAAIAAKRKTEMDAEIERVKKEFEEKAKRKKESQKESEKDKAGQEKSKQDQKDKSDDNKDRNTSPAPEQEPRVFTLAKPFYQKRLDKKRAADIAKRNRERLSNPSLFPSVPKDLP